MAASQFETRSSSRDSSSEDNAGKELKNSDMFLKLFLMILLFVMSLSLLCLLYKAHPEVPPEFAHSFWRAVPTSLSFSELSKIRDLENVKTVFSVVSLYKDSHQVYIVSTLSATYLFFQAFPLFMIWLPGTGSAISLLIGALFGFFKGIVICIILATVGPILAYSLFAYTGKPILSKWFPSKIADMKKQLDSHSDNLIGYLVFLRVSPFPNFLINMASPVIGVPLKSFVFATFLGLIPNTITLVSMGVTLKELTSLHTGVGMMIGLLAVLALGSLVPGILKRRFESNHKEIKTS